jgi:hypothetical protein
MNKQPVDSDLQDQLRLVDKWLKDAGVSLPALCKAAKPPVDPAPIYRRKNGQEPSLMKPDTMERLRAAYTRLRGHDIDEAPVIASDFDPDNIRSGEQMTKEIAQIALDFLKKLPPGEARQVFNEYADWLRNHEAQDRSHPTRRA